MSKAEISRSYTELMRERHGGKSLRADHTRVAAVVGAGKKGSIGEAVVSALRWRGIAVWVPTLSEVNVLYPGTMHDYFAAHPEIDTLVCAQGMTRLDWIENQDSGDIQEVVDVTLTGSILLSSFFVKATIDAPYRKQIVFIGSMAYNHVLNASAPYCAAKAGLAHYTRCLAWELAPKGFDVYCVHPSNVDGAPMTEETIQGLMRVRGIDRAAAEDYWDAGRIHPWVLTPGEIARVVIDLLEPEARYLSGSNIELNGGGR